MKNIYVVGDKFRNYIDDVDIIGFSQLLFMLKRLKARKNNAPSISIWMGQGINTSEIRLFNQLIKKYHLERQVNICGDNPLDKASNTLTHKHHQKNTLISDPQKMDDEHYVSKLLIDDDCAEMSDHLTGQHIQGMTLIEAARQQTIAVTEKYFVGKDENVGFSTDSLATEFYQYVFPLSCELQYTIISKRKFGCNAKYKVNVEFVQNNKICLKVVYQFSVYEKSYLKGKESQLKQASLSLFNEMQYRKAG